MITIKNEKEIELMRQSANIMKKVLKKLEEETKEGVAPFSLITFSAT